MVVPVAWKTVSKEPVSVTFVGGDALGDAWCVWGARSLRGL
jgi:hypothetical protein